jgi:ribose 5-phosphate isomerase B
MIAIAADHGGFEMKQEIIKMLEQMDLKYKDFGTYSDASMDYPDVAKPACQSIIDGECEKGILICGTGIGISITANKMKGIRAALCSNCYSAKATREHNDANVLALGGRVTGIEVAKEIVLTFLNTDFSNDERHIRRINKIEE